MIVADELRSIETLMQGYDLPWGVCGGWAIDLFLNRQTRPHKDIDIAVLQRDQLHIQALMQEHGWTLEIAYQGRFEVWQMGEFIAPPRHNIWCRKPAALPDFFQILLNEADDTHFLFRRDRTIGCPLEQSFLRTVSGIPILAPEIVLLYKSNRPEDAANRADFQVCWPILSSEQQSWLKAALKRDHPWLKELV